MAADPFLVMAREPGPLQPLRPLPGGPPEARLKRASRQVVPDPGRTGFAADPLAAAISAGSWRGWVARLAPSVSRAGWQSLFTDRAVDRFAEEVRVAGVAGSLLDDVQQHPPE